MEQNEFSQRRQKQEAGVVDLFVLLVDFFKGLKRFRRLLLVLPLLGALLGLGYAAVQFDAVYTASAVFSAKTASSAKADEMTELFSYLADNDVIRDEIAEHLSADVRNSRISVSVGEESKLITVSVRSESQEDALDIMQALILPFTELARHVFGSAELTVVQAPSVTDQPVRQGSYARTAAKGLLAGLALALLCCAVYACTRRTIRQEEELERQLSCPCIGMLPRASLRKKTGAAGRAVTIVNPDVGSRFCEAVRYLRTSLLDDLRAHPQERVILVAGTLPGEGVATAAGNIAMTLARNGASVVLVDANLCAPHIAALFQLEDADCGLPQVLRGEVPLENALHTAHAVRVLSGGSGAERDGVWRHAQSMQALLEELKRQADYVVVAAAPGETSSDAVVLGRLADCALYVVRQDFAAEDAVRAGLARLARSRVRLVGCVLNDVPAGVSGYGMYDGRSTGEP
ncbi:MAG TPA: P-loop NTPase [Candidatus Butyricicoccus stercorigallinarum]|nr:P-loop NTPase [Candidatus Butyricicoccus stercorigallinarum]